MKKLSLLVALFMCLTIGGVYATWSYAGTNDIGDAFAEAKVTIAEVELTGANGTYKVESNLVLTVDQANDEHDAELVFASNNSDPIFLKVTFTPAGNAPQTIKDNAVPTQLYFSTTTAMQYKIDGDGNYSETGTATDIFKFDEKYQAKDFELAEKITWNEESDGSFTYTMDVDALKAAIMLNQTFKLDTKAEYDAFKAALAGNIVANVTDGIVTGSN